MVHSGFCGGVFHLSNVRSKEAVRCNCNALGVGNSGPDIPESGGDYMNHPYFNAMALLILFNREFTRQHGLAIEIAEAALRMTLGFRRLYEELERELPTAQILEFRRAL